MTSTHTAARTTFRRGDLRRALLHAGIALARDGGPDAVVLREATRRAGVVPDAAHRHFKGRSALLQAVRAAALAAVAAAMEAELATLRRSHPTHFARASVRAVGTAYDDPDAAKAGPSGMNPFQLLGLALDRLVNACVMTRAQAEALGQRVLDMVEKGL